MSSKVKPRKSSAKSGQPTQPSKLEKPTPIPNTGTTLLNSESEQQFEVELCWCIQQLQLTLNSGKLNQKQVQDTTKTLNTLMSNTAPLIKKRQAMRLTFGDYRAKMSEEDKKLSKALTKIRFKAAAPSKKSLFVKKSSVSGSSENSFKFNFDIPECDRNVACS